MGKPIGKQSESFAAQVLRAVAEIGGEVTTTAISHHLDLRTRAAEKKALNALSDLFKAGRVVRIRPATYTLPTATGKEPVPIQERMWRVLRMRRVVTVADLQELADASEEYCWEWLRMLIAREVVRKISHGPNKPCSWQLINDTVEMPVDDTNAARLREMRAKQRTAVVEALDRASTAISEARQAIMKINEEEPHE